MCNCTNKCQKCSSGCTLRYTGEDIECLGITKNDLIEDVIQTISEYICPLVEAEPCCQEIVAYTIERLGATSLPTFPTISAITGTSYTVPAGAGGTYELVYTGETVFDATVGNYALYSVYINNVEYNIATARKTAIDGDGNIPFNILISNLTLAEGDVIDVRGTCFLQAASYAQNAIFKLTKLP